MDLPTTVASASAGERPRGCVPPKIKTCLVYFFIILCIPVVIFPFFLIVEDAIGYYEVKITDIDASNFPPAAATAARNYTASPPSFNITAWVQNHYHSQVCFGGWEVAVFYDGVPLGRGAFPVDRCAKSMGGGSMMATTESGLVGLDDEVRSRMARRGQTPLEELDLQIDMKQGVVLGNGGGCNWFRCTARLFGHPKPTAFCRFKLK